MTNSNTSRDRAATLARASILSLTALAAAACIPSARALDPNRAMIQYTHDRWGPEQGFPGGGVYSIAETSDGYLWIGAEQGLVRFDGLNFHLMKRAEASAIPPGPVLGLIADAEGNLWIRTQGLGLLRYRDGVFEDVMAGHGWADTRVTAMCRSKNGQVLFVSPVVGVFTYNAGKLTTLASTADLPHFLVISMADTASGGLWMGTRDMGLFSLSGGKISPVAPASPDRKINCLLALENRELWIGTDTGIVRWNGAELVNAVPPGASERFQTLAMTRDHESNIWVGTAGGLLRFNSSGVSSLEQPAERLGGAVTALFEDRENNLWFGGAQGLERFRDSAFLTYPAPAGRQSDNNGPLFVDHENRTWFAPSDGGLFWLKGTRTGRVAMDGLDRDVVYSISGGSAELWIARQRGGLTHLDLRGGSFTAQTYTQSAGLAQNSLYAVHRNRDGTVWAGSLSNGVSSFKDGIFATYTTSNGLASNSVSSIAEGPEGTMWFATPNGLSEFSKSGWRTYTGREGLPPGNVNCLLMDANGVLWIGTSEGLAFLSAGQVTALREAPEVLREQVYGIAEDKRGSLWIATSSHVLRVNRGKLLSGAVSDSDLREYGIADGLHSLEGVKRQGSVVSDAMGRIWFSLNRGISVVDPARLTSGSAPALVHVLTITADGRAIPQRATVRIPPATHRVALSYVGLSLSIPERVRYRYRMDGVDRNWSEPTATREAIYNNLSPGPYRFRVVASNSDGLWNSTEGTVLLNVAPAFWQTWWFRTACVLACVFVVLASYRYRLHQLTAQLNVRFEERLAERTRIAQELHDTLLQGFLSASMQLHVAADQVPADSPAKPMLGRVLELMRQVIDEGRNALRGLRAPDRRSGDLAEELSRIPQELALRGEADFRIIVEGRPRTMHPMLRDEVYRIGREALVNAFRHSRARSIEVELEYGASQLRLLIRDNGCGIDPQVLRAGREGHWGLPGMRERAERVGGRLSVWSSPTAGTEVALSVPGNIAFQNQSAARPLGWFAKYWERSSGRNK